MIEIRNISCCPLFKVHLHVIIKGLGLGVIQNCVSYIILLTIHTSK